jgi:thiosulfate dehydrogenase [quinone] large subunit
MTAVTDRVAARSGMPVTTRTTAAVFLVVRVGVALLWIQNVMWKLPPDFGRARNADLFVYVNDAVEHPVVAPWSWVVEHVVLPNYVAFGWMTLLAESAIGAFLLVGLATRLFALLGVAQSIAIALSVLNTPGEWHWSYYLMIMAHLMLFAVAAGRAYGVDAVLRPMWLASSGRLARLLALAS